MADGINYKDAFVITKVISQDGSNRLDLPFPVYSYCITSEGINYGISIPENLIGKEVMAFVHIAIKDEESAKKFSGYISEKWEDARKDIRVTKHWYEKKEDAFSISDTVLGEPIVSKYDGLDCKEICHPYLADDRAIKMIDGKDGQIQPDK